MTVRSSDSFCSAFSCSRRYCSLACSRSFSNPSLNRRTANTSAIFSLCRMPRVAMSSCNRRICSSSVVEHRRKNSWAFRGPQTRRVAFRVPFRVGGPQPLREFVPFDLVQEILQDSLPQEQLAAFGRQLLGDPKQLGSLELLLPALDIQYLLQTPCEALHESTIEYCKSEIINSSGAYPRPYGGPSTAGPSPGRRSFGAPAGSGIR